MSSKYFLSCYAARPYDGVQSVNDEDVICPLDKDQLDSLCPVNIVTGLRDQPLARILDPSVSDSERQALLSTLNKFNVPDSDKNVDDETKLLFVKLRSIQTPSELSQFRSAIQQWLDNNSDGASSDGASSDGASSDGASSDGASSDGASSDGASSE